MSWIPTEHGGYAMLLFPMVSALALPGAGAHAWALALLIFLLYLAHRMLLRACGASRLAQLARSTASGQLAASVALASLSAPVALAAGGSLVTVVTLALVWAGGFAMTALAVRAVLERGCPRRAAWFVRAALAAALAATAALAWLARAGRVPPSAPLCLAPLLAVACLLALRPPEPRRLRVIGWTLAAACGLTLAQVAALW